MSSDNGLRGLWGSTAAKRLISVRKSHPVLGRGELHFLSPENQHVLAYLRNHEGVTVLVVGNLAATPQTVALDLSDHTGATPIDLLSDEPMPPITVAHYELKLAPYEFRWLMLQHTGMSNPPAD